MTWAYLDSIDTPFGFAHRGGTDAAPENTLAAFHHATELGYRYLETDVHRTSDGVLVAFHDQALERMTGLVGGIADYTWSTLAEAEVQGHKIPTLDELFETFPDARFNIDPKADDAVDLLADTIEKHDALDRVCVGSFSDERVEHLRDRLGPRLCASPGPRMLAKIWASSFRRGGSARGYAAVQIPPTYGPIRLTKRQVERFRQLGLHVHVWTINDETEMQRLLDLGVDALMSDRVELLKSVLLERGSWQ